MSFGSRLLAARERRDYSQSQLCKLVKMDQAQLSNMENGAREPSVKNLRKLARILDVSADYLLELSDSTQRINGRREP